MKKTFLILAAIAMVVFAGSAWAVPTINFIETNEIDPVQITSSDLPQKLLFIIPASNPVVTDAGAEFAHVAFYLNGPDLPLTTSGSTYVTRMNEPNSDVFSDLVVLKAVCVSPCFGIYTLDFYSDGYPDIPSLTPNKTIYETGGLDLVMDLPGLQVYAKSDVGVAPIPGSLLLLGSGILGLVGIGTRRKTA